MDARLILNDQFNDLIFENRNKKYGAFENRRRYRRNVLLAGIIASLLAGAGVGLIPSGNTNNFALIPIRDRQDTIPIMLPPDDPNEKIKQKLTQSTPPAKGSKLETVPVIVDKPTVPDPVIDSAGTTTGEPGGTGIAIQDSTQNNPCTDCDGDSAINSGVVYIADTLPECPSCEPFILKHMRYPEIARREGIEGTVALSFIVDKNGEVKEVKVIQSAHPLLDQEAVRVAWMMPKWKPGRMNGRAINFLYQKAFRFRLE